MIKLPCHLRCAAHNLNLTGSTDFLKAIKTLHVYTRHKTVLQKCYLLWKGWRHPKTSEIIKDTLQGSLIYPTVTH